MAQVISLSLFGLFGVLLAWEEGLEINVLTFNLGFNPFKLHAKFPFIGSAGITLPKKSNGQFYKSSGSTIPYSRRFSRQIFIRLIRFSGFDSDKSIASPGSLLRLWSLKFRSSNGRSIETSFSPLGAHMHADFASTR